MAKSPREHKAGERKSAPPSRESREPFAGGIGNSIRASCGRDRVVLFAGGTCKNWLNRNGGPAAWEVREGVLRVVPGAGDLLTRERFQDFFLHLDFLCPDMPEATGQDKGNSGVFLQGRYEIQVLDSFGIELPGRQDCGAVYGRHAPLANACKAPGCWQAFDMVFRAARLCGFRVLERPRVTVFLNATVIQNNVELPGPTGGGLDEGEGPEGPLLLQDHGCPVAYRNIWAVRLPVGVAP